MCILTCARHVRMACLLQVPLEQLVASLLWECPLPRPTVSVSLPLGRERIVFAKPAPGAELPVHELRAPSLLHALPAEGLLALFAAACVEHKIEHAPPRRMCTLVCIVTCILSCAWRVHGVCLAGASSTRSCSSRRTPRS